MHSLPTGYRAVVVGASGAIGAAIVSQLEADSHCAEVIALNRKSEPTIDFTDEGSIARAASALRGGGEFRLLIIATGVLHSDTLKPEKRLGDISHDNLLHSFTVNALGPAIVLKHFLPLMPKHGRSLAGVLSARLGSISDNHLGGWYSYRVSKAALNMMVRTTAIEWSRTHPEALIAALHPGTVSSALSAPFRKTDNLFLPVQAANNLLTVLDELGLQDSGSFFAYDGSRIPW